MNSSNDTCYYVIGGRQKPGADEKEEWFRFEKAVILHVDPSSGEVSCPVEYVSPPDARPDAEFSCLFKAGTVQGDKLYVCTQTELIVYSLPSFQQLHYLSLPCFNDLHHVLPTNRSTVLVANTGLDMVLETTLEGEIVREWGALGQDPWQRFSRETDYRKVATTKPHESHPNYVYELGEDVWVTRFVQKDAVCLGDMERRVAIDVERPHDGCLTESGAVYFTTVDGNVVKADAHTTKIEQVYDLNQLSGIELPLGWCRGLSVVEEDQVVVGFSRLRPTKFKQNVRWAKVHLGLETQAKLLPTRIAAFDLAHSERLWEIDLERYGISAIFSIHPVRA